MLPIRHNLMMMMMMMMMPMTATGDGPRRDAQVMQGKDSLLIEAKRQAAFSFTNKTFATVASGGESGPGML